MLGSTVLCFTASFIHPFSLLKLIALRVLTLGSLILFPSAIKRIRWHSTDILVMIWLAWQLLSGLIDTTWPLSVPKSEQLILLGVFYLIVRSTFNTSSAIIQLAKALLIIAGVQSAIGLLQYAELFPWTVGFFQGFESQVTGTVGGANVLGAFLAATLPFGYLFLISVNGRERILWLVVLITSITVMVLSKSRGAWVAAGIGFGVFLWPTILSFLISNRRIKMVLILSIPIVTTISGFLIYYIYQLNPDSADGRLFIWAVSWDMIRDHLFTGVGYGNFGLHWLEYQGAYFAQGASGLSHGLAVNLTSAHSQYLQTFAETGLIGLASLVALLGYLPFALRKTKKTINKSERLILMAIMAAIVTIGIHGIVEDVLVGIPVQVLFIMLLAMLVGMVSEPEETLPEYPEIKLKWSHMILIPLFAFAVFQSWHEIQGELLWKEVDPKNWTVA